MYKYKNTLKSKYYNKIVKLSNNKSKTYNVCV